MGDNLRIFHVFSQIITIIAYEPLSIFIFSSNINILSAILLYQLGGLGITGGAHRLWAHRSYKAKWQLRLFLTFCNTLAFQVSSVNIKL